MSFTLAKANFTRVMTAAIALGLVVGSLSLSKLARAQADESPPAVIVRKVDSAETTGVRLPEPPSVEGTATIADAPVELIPDIHHEWARFGPSSWRTIRTITESFDPAGKFVGRSETTQTDTLIESTAESYTIESTTVVSIGGKQLRGAASQTTYFRLSQSGADPAEVIELPAANLNLQGRVLSCRRWQMSFGEGPERRIETIFYSPDLSPFLLRRETSAADGTAETTLLQSTTAVVRVDVPVTVDDALMPGSHVTVTSQSGGNRIDRLEVRSAAVPGGLVSASSTERDSSGRKNRWSTVELVDYGLAGETLETRPRWRLFRRRGR